MIRLTFLALASVFLVGALSGVAGDDKSAPDAKPAKVAFEPYNEFKADQSLLRKHLVHKAKDGSKDTKASSGEACQAAQRIFSRISFLFRTRAEILELLGDPATISDYNEPAGKDLASPMVYIFDTGFGGLKYTISFGHLDRVRVTQVQVDSQN
jgi:hypothetical protein